MIGRGKLDIARPAISLYIAGMKRRDFLAAGSAAALIPMVTPAEAARLQSIRVTRNGSLPLIRPDWPVPQEPNQLLFLQRSMNSNTIVFTARYDSAGNLAWPDPVHVYWRRYNTDGARKPLKPIERMVAFGVDVRRRAEPGQFDVSMKPLPQLAFLLLQTGPGQSQALARIGGQTARPIYAFARVNDDGLIPSVTELSVHGLLPNGGGAISEYYSVSGGRIR